MVNFAYSNRGLSVNDAVELYERLRKRGQNSTLARLSVEARLSNLPLNERRQVHDLLIEAESQKSPLELLNRNQ